MVFRYRYDYRKRRISTQIPSQDGEQKIVYDAKDRIVLTQSPKQALENEWNYIKYDVFDRPVITGVATISLSHEQLMTQLATQKQFITLIGGNVQQDAFPKVGNAGVTKVEARSITFYDSYEGINTAVYGFQPVAHADFTNPSASNWALDEKTIATKVKGIRWNRYLVMTVNHFDKKGRIIQDSGR